MPAKNTVVRLAKRGPYARNSRFKPKDFTPSPHSSPLVVSKDKELTKFPTNANPRFSDFRTLPGIGYFDKTKFIPAISKEDGIQLFCRPDHFGKSLVASMLKSFHGTEYRTYYNILFEGLEVDKAVKNDEIAPGQYLTMSFRFSGMDRHPMELARKMNIGLVHFRRRYAEKLGIAVERLSISTFNTMNHFSCIIRDVNGALERINKKGNEDHPLKGVKGIYLFVDNYDDFASGYMDLNKPSSWTKTSVWGLCERFWAKINEAKNYEHGIKKAFVTGVVPLRMKNFKVDKDITFDPKFSNLCGLTRVDAADALSFILDDSSSRRNHLRALTNNLNRYRFCKDSTAEPVFNTKTLVSYFQALRGFQRPMIMNHQNVRTIDSVLKLCTRSAVAGKDITLALQEDEYGRYPKISYNKFVDSFIPVDLTPASEGKDVPAWLSLMVYQGDLTFDKKDPSALVIPSRAAAARMKGAIVMQESLTGAVNNFPSDGDIVAVLTAYRSLMAAHEVGAALKKTKADHRKRLHEAILQNPDIKANVNGAEILELRTGGYYVAVQLKHATMDALGLGGNSNTVKKFEAITLDQTLKLRFNRKRHEGVVIKDWLNKIAYPQLERYVLSSVVQEESIGKQFRAYLAVIIGSRKILLREMNGNGEWIGDLLDLGNESGGENTPAETMTKAQKRRLQAGRQRRGIRGEAGRERRRERKQLNRADNLVTD